MHGRRRKRRNHRGGRREFYGVGVMGFLKLRRADAVGADESTDSCQRFGETVRIAEAGVEKALLTRPELFATTITEKLLTYSLGRGVEYTDAPAVRQIVRQAQKSDFRFSSFIQGIAGSPSFQLRRAQ